MVRQNWFFFYKKSMPMGNVFSFHTVRFSKEFFIWSIEKQVTKFGTKIFFETLK
jgi:hypothetical protein